MPKPVSNKNPFYPGEFRESNCRKGLGLSVNMCSIFTIIFANHLSGSRNAQRGLTSGAVGRFSKAFNIKEVVHSTMEGHRSLCPAR